MTQAVNLTESIVYAGFWRRLAAVLVDTLIVLPVIAALVYLLSDGNISLEALNADPLAFYNPSASLAMELAIMALVIFFWVRFCGTPGKLLLGCQIVDANSGQPLTISRAILRYIAYLISALPLMLGFLWIAFDRRKQGFHDKIARSVVIIEDESAKPLQQLQQESR